MELNLLVPLDGSKRAESALAVAVALARSEDLPLLLVHALPSSGSRAEAAGIHQDELARSRKYLDRLCSRLRKKGVQARSKSLSGEASGVVVRTAVREGSGLIVLSGRGHGGASGPLGSIAERILRTSTVPVLLLRGRRPLPRSVLIPPGCPLDLLARVGRLVRALEAEALLCRPARRTDAQARAERDVLTRLGVSAREVPVPGLRSGGLEEMARMLEIDLVVLPAGSAKIASGGAAGRLLAEPSLSILLTPARR